MWKDFIEPLHHHPGIPTNTNILYTTLKGTGVYGDYFRNNSSLIQQIMYVLQK